MAATYRHSSHTSSWLATVGLFLSRMAMLVISERPITCGMGVVSDGSIHMVAMEAIATHGALVGSCLYMEPYCKAR